MFDTRLYEAHILSRHYRPLNPFKSPTSPPLITQQAHTSTSLLLLSEEIETRIPDFEPESSSYTNSFMAQRTEKEETEFKVPETLTLCINNCGVTGNPATNNMCQKCFNATTSTSTSTSNSSTSTTTNAPATTSMTFTSTIAGVSNEILKFTGEKSSRSTSSSRSPVKNLQKWTESTSDRGRSDDSSVGKREVTRCSGCRRKVGLTGFRCRCGELFCWEHRYSDRHDCSYDYKAAGREAIARENPVVKAAKIVRV